jgi:DNA-directed RNA polymerase subunit omega
MARITVEDCLKNVDNRFILVHMANKRTRQLYKGAKPLVDAEDNREIVKALREVAALKVNLDDETDAALRQGGYMTVAEEQD